MREFTIHLTREYVVQILAKSQDDAKFLTELYVSGGFDDSNELTQKKYDFQIKNINPILSEAISLE